MSSEKDSVAEQKFKDTYDKMKAPEAWKQEVLHAMQEEEMKIKENRARADGTDEEINENTKAVKKKFGPKTIRLVAAAATLCAAALCLLIILPKGAPYVTKMEDGVYYDDIELKDGEIHFVSNRVAISISPNAGTAFSTTQEAEENLTEVLLAESGGMITFEETESQNLPEIAESDWSYIGEQKIYVTVLKTEEARYQAVFEKNGTTYEMIGTGVTQKEFVDELYSRVKE